MRKFWTEHKIAIVVVILSILVWFADSIIDAIFFYDEGFTAVGFTDVSMYEIYFRLSIIAIIVIAGYILSLRIKEKRKIQASLEFERNQILNIYNSIDEPIYIIDPDTETIVFCNDAAKSIYRSEEEECEKNILDDSVRSNIIRIKEALAKDPDRQVVIDIYNKEYDKWFHTINRIIVWFDDTKMIFTFAVDITQLKKSELEMLRTSKFETMEVMADTIIHDFNNILSIAMMNIELAKKQVLKGGNTDQSIHGVEYAINSALDVIKHLKRFTKDAELNIEETDIEKLINETVEFVFKDAKIKTEKNFEPGLQNINIDKGQIIQVMHNILLNARQAMDDKGIVKLNVRKINIKDSDRMPAGDYLSISIHNSGPAIPPDVMIKIFNPYFTTKKAGTGLGLSSCYLIVKKHKGDIQVVSEEGKGTTFTIYLPVSAA